MGHILGERFLITGYIGDHEHVQEYECLDKHFPDGKRILRIFKDKPEPRKLKALKRVLIAQQKLDHPNIEKCYECFEIHGFPAKVSEYVEGSTLAELIKSYGALEPFEVQFFLYQIAAALKCMHNSGIIHRDLKTSNIIATQSGLIKITDFGLALFQSLRSLKTTLK